MICKWPNSLSVFQGLVREPKLGQIKIILALQMSLIDVVASFCLQNLHFSCGVFTVIFPLFCHITSGTLLEKFCSMENNLLYVVVIEKKMNTSSL